MNEDLVSTLKHSIEALDEIPPKHTNDRVEKVS